MRSIRMLHTRKYKPSVQSVSQSVSCSQATCSIMSAGMGVPDKYNASKGPQRCPKEAQSFPREAQRGPPKGPEVPQRGPHTSNMLDSVGRNGGSG